MFVRRSDERFTEAFEVLAAVCGGLSRIVAVSPNKEQSEMKAVPADNISIGRPIPFERVTHRIRSSGTCHKADADTGHKSKVSIQGVQPSNAAVAPFGGRSSTCNRHLLFDSLGHDYSNIPHSFT